MANRYLQSIDSERVLVPVPPFQVSDPREQTCPSSASVGEYSDHYINTTPSRISGSFQGSPIWSLRSPVNRTQSIATTPLSNASFDAGQRSSTIGEQPQTIQPNRSISTDQGAFIPYNPVRRKKRKDAPPNTCVPCYIKHRSCQPSHDPSVCGKCLGKGMYCMGDVNFEEFADPDSWIQFAITTVEHGCRPLGRAMNQMPSLVLEIDSGQELSPKFGDRSNSAIRLPYELDSSLYPNLVGRQSLTAALDLMLPSLLCPITSTPATNDHILATLELCCRRLTASLTLLSTPKISCLHLELLDHNIAPWVAVGFMYHVNSETCRLLRELATQLNRFFRAPRNRQTFSARVWTAAYCLGSCYQVAKALRAEQQLRHETGSILAKLCSGTNALLVQLEKLGRGLDPEGFASGTACELQKVSGIRIGLKETHPLSASTWVQERSYKVLDSVLAECSKPGDPPRRIPPKAIFHLGAESPEPDPDFDQDISEIPIAIDSSLTSDPMLFSLAEQEALENRTRVLVSEMKLELVKLAGEVTDRQSRMRELENKIQLAELCLPLCRSEAKGSHSFFNDVRLGESADSQQETSSVTPEMGSLTFSPSDQTLVEQGLGAMLEAQSLPFMDEDIEMIVPFGVEPPAALEDRCQRNLDPFEEFVAYDQIQATAARAPLEGRNRKRRRLSGILPPQSSLVEFSGPVPKDCTTQNTMSAHGIDSSQRDWKLDVFRNRGRLSRILLGQLSTLQTRLEGITPPKMDPHSKTESSKVDAERPVSYPQSQRWRKSLGVSVKSLTEGFERMRVKQQET